VPKPHLNICIKLGPDHRRILTNGLSVVVRPEGQAESGGGVLEKAAASKELWGAF